LSNNIYDLKTNIEKIDWLNKFPYDKPREQQTEVINKVLNEFKSGKKYAIIDCGTGVGKSAIGLTIASHISNHSSEYDGVFEEGAYFLTTQRVLQDQYEKDFKSKGLVSLSSSTNYSCKLDNGACCKDILTGIRSGSLSKKYDSCNYNCTYKNKKKDFIEKKLGITNFSYFLTEKNYSQKVPNKRVLVIDEAHNLESELTRFIEVSISSYFSEKILRLKVPKGLNTQFKVYNWIKTVYHPELVKKIGFINSQLKKFGITSTKLEEFKKITNRFELLTSHEKKIIQFIELYNNENWIFDIEKVNNSHNKFIFKPVDISKYAHQYLLKFADYVIFMSATIISHEGFSLTIGLPSDKIVSIKSPSPFPAENRPIIYSPAGSMSSKNIEKTLPVLKTMVEEIMNNHKDEKGIIHTHSIKIANYLKNTIRNKRIIVAYGDKREAALQKHIKSKLPTILISPSMTEGVDLKGKLSEFQILCKVPFPYLGDKVVKKKMSKWKWWYNTQTIRTIIQSIGRSIRSKDDKAVTYILDSDWKRIKSMCRNDFPKDFFDNYHEF
jgi:ATP-dependent DNA helicase DinG